MDMLIAVIWYIGILYAMGLTDIEEEKSYMQIVAIILLIILWPFVISRSTR